MNDLGIALICSAFQVTLLGSLAAVLYLFASRRASATAARVAALGLGACVVLTLAAVCRLPSWWSWALLLERSASVSSSAPGNAAETPDSLEEKPSPSEATDAHVSAEGLWIDWSLTRLRGAWENLARQQVKAETVACSWPSVVVILFACGAGFGLLRLGAGLWSVSRYRRHSRIIPAAAPLDLLASLQRTTSCPCRVEVRESPDLSTPATIGWQRPLILLPVGWREWTEDELRAVLAHELAHVRRWDYAACLLARISLAVHFYHPLVYWLAGRLQLQQELAADAFGAACLGGRERYLRILARLLLREDIRPPRWPARAFLSPFGTLLRRIDMLRVQDGSSRQRLPRSATAFLAVVLALAGVGISALRGPAQQSKENRDEVQRNQASSAGKLARPVPFDLTYVNPDAQGVLALRPATFLHRPGMELFAALAKKEVAPLLAACGIAKDIAPSIETIEQVIAEAHIDHNEKAPKGQRNQWLMSLTALRTEKPFDWKKLMQTLVPNAEEVRYQEQTYYKGELKAIGPMKAIGSKIDLCYFFPDGRTVVFHPEKVMRRVLDNLAGERPTFPWASDWQGVDRGMMAIMHNTRQARKIIKDAGELAPLIEHTTHVVVGVDVNENFAVQALARCLDEKSAKIVAKWTRTQLAEEIAEEQKEGDKQDPIADRLSDDLLKQARVLRHGTKVSLRTQTKITGAELGKMLISLATSSK